MEKKKSSSYYRVYQEYRNKIKSNKNKALRRKLFVFGTIGILLFVVFLYFISPISRLKTISVKGNELFSNQKVLEIGRIQYNDFYLFVFPAGVEKNLENNPFIESAIVNKTGNGSLEIVISEKRIFAYQFGEDSKIYFFNGSEATLSEAELSYLMNVPYLNGFLELEVRNRVRLAFFDVEESVFRMISEIHEYSTSYDEHMLRIVMQDGNQVFTSLLSLKSLNYYLEILNHLKVANSCIYIDEISGSAYSTVCPKEEDIGEIIEIPTEE